VLARLAEIKTMKIVALKDMWRNLYASVSVVREFETDGGLI